jgi:alanyl-tRNA synthetase
MLNARYHTAGHLVSNIVEEVEPSLKAVKCHAFPKESYVEFPLVATVPDSSVVQNRLIEVIKGGIETKIFDISAEDFERSFYKLPYDIPGREAFRVMQIGTYPPVPCGGTHLKNISEVGNINVKIASKKGIVRVSYLLP